MCTPILVLRTHICSLVSLAQDLLSILAQTCFQTLYSLWVTDRGISFPKQYIFEQCSGAVVAQSRNAVHRRMSSDINEIFICRSVFIGTDDFR